MFIRTKLFLMIIIVLLGFTMIITLDYCSDSRTSALMMQLHNGLSALSSVSRLNSWTKELLIAPKNNLNEIFDHWKEVYTGTSVNVAEFLESKVLEDLFIGSLNEAQFTLIKEQWSIATEKLDTILAGMEEYGMQTDLSKKGGLFIDLSNIDDEYAFNLRITVLEGISHLSDEFDMKYRKLIEDLESMITSESGTISIISNILITIIISVIVILSLLFTKMIHSSLKKVETGMKNVADGNFSSTIGIESNDEIGILANNFDIFVNTLKTKLDSTLSYMKKVGSAMSDKFKIKEVIQLITESAAENTQADGCILLLIDEENPENIIVEGLVGFFPPTWLVTDFLKNKKIQHLIKYVKNTPVKMGENIIGKSIAENKSVFIQNTLYNDKLANENLNKESVLYISSLAIVPLVISDRVIGAISVVKTKENTFFTDLDYNHIQSFAEYATLTIDNLVKHIQLLEKHELEREVGIAAQIQKRLLPRTLPKLKNSTVKAFSNPLKGVSGDYYDLIKLDEDKTAIIMCDVAGKGVPAALVMIMINTIIKLTSSTERGAAEMLSWLNKGLAGRVGEGNFATIGYVVFNQKTREVLYSNAAHIPMILYREKKKKFFYIDVEGLPIGVDMNAQYKQKRFILSEGDVLVMYTDGISEAMNKNGDQYETKSIIKVLKKCVFLSAEEILNKIKEDLAKYVKGAKQHDDQTLLVLKGN